MILKAQRIATMAMVLLTAVLLTAQVMIARASNIPSDTNIKTSGLNFGTGQIHVLKIVAGSPPNPYQVFTICLSGPAPDTTVTCQEIKNGEVKSWSGLFPGDYTLSETDPGSNWQVNIDHPIIRINPDGSTNYNLSGALAPLCTEATITNTYRQTGQIDVRKVVNWNGATPNPEQIFSICLAGPSFPLGPDCQSFRDGEEKTWTGLIPGVYTVSEENPGSQWSVTIDHPIIQVNSDGSLTWLSNSPLAILCNGATVTNTLEFGSLKVTKIVDWANLDPVAGQTFKICIQGPSFPSIPDCKNFTYPNDLVQSWTRLVPGDYWVSEPETGSGWQVSVPAGPVTVGPGKEGQAAVTNTHKIKVALTTTPKPAVEQVGAILNDSAVLSGGTNPSGVITFKLFPPSDRACSGAPVYMQEVPVSQGNATYNTAPGYASNQAGSWNWTADYSGDANHLPASSGCTAETVTIRKTSPALNTLPNPAAGMVGDVLNDSAVLSGGYAPTGSILFSLYPPSDLACAGNPIYSQSVAVESGQSNYATAPGFASNAAGTWRWTAAYSGDANNTPANSGCQDENVTIEKVHPTINTLPNPVQGLVGDMLNDSANLNGFYNPTGSILFKLFPPSDVECARTAVYTETVSVNGNSNYETHPGYPSDQAGTWRWTADYSGDANNFPASSGCTLEPVTIKARTGSINVKKQVEWNGLPPDPTLTFEICLTGPDALPVTSCKTFSAGQTQTWDNLTPGSYSVSEPTPGPEWKTTIDPSVVIISPDGTASVELVTVTNTRRLGSLVVTKRIDWNRIIPDPQVSFEICITGPSFPLIPNCKQFNAASGWTQTWNNLIPGEYSLSETEPGSEWKVMVPAGPVAVPIDGGSASAEVTNQRKLGSLAVTKNVIWNGVTPIQGQTFEICIWGPSFPQPGDCKTFTYPTTLTQTWTNLIPGDYWVVEKNSGSEWQVQISSAHVIVPIDGGTGQTQVTNTRKLGSLQVVKVVDWKGVLPDPGKIFRICIQGPSFPGTPDCKPFGASTGWVQTWNSLIPGSYTLSEENPGDEWVVTIETSTVTIPIDGSATAASVTNTFKSGGLTVVKAVDWGTAVPDPEKMYEICITGPSFPVKNCKYAGYLGGELTWTNLIPGTYEVSETDPGMNWKVSIPDAPATVKAGVYTTTHVNNKVEEPTGINMVYFRAARQSDKQVKLTWLSAMENNLSGFKIYRSTSPEFNTRQYAGFIQAGGSGTSYEFTDAPPGNGCWFYWLVSVDTNASAYVLKRADVVIGDYFVYVPVLK